MPDGNSSKSLNKIVLKCKSNTIYYSLPVESVQPKSSLKLPSSAIVISVLIILPLAKITELAQNTMFFFLFNSK